MKDFGIVTLTAARDVDRNERVSLLSLFDAAARFQSIVPQFGAEEGTVLAVDIGGIARVELTLGADIRAGRRKNIMTLFWYAERAKEFTLQSGVRQGMQLVVTLRGQQETSS